MKYHVCHKTAYTYAEEVDLASHMLHLRPRTFAAQRVESTWIESLPKPGRQSESVDHFGNPVIRVFIDKPHDSFVVTSEAVVDVLFPDPPAPEAALPWEQVAKLARHDGAHHEAAEFLFASPMIPLLDETRHYAAVSFPKGGLVVAGVIGLNNRIRKEFSYRSGATVIGTPIARVMQRREGVCQDFAHLMISALRGLGIPARYVSGYLRTHSAPGMPALRGADQSHAWVSAWIGPEFGWLDVDPTNNLVVKDEHVVIAWGRDFEDVSPLRGIILGGGRHSLSVSVDLAPEELDAV